MSDVKKLINEMEIKSVAHLPIVSAYCDMIGIAYTVHGSVSSKMQVSLEDM